MSLNIKINGIDSKISSFRVNFQSCIYCTSACLPSVFTSFLKVVNSSFKLLNMSVTVPCFIPVETTLNFVFLNLFLFHLC